MKRPLKFSLSLSIWLLGVLLLSIVAILRWPQDEWMTVDFQSLLPADTSNHWISLANETLINDYDNATIWLIEGRDLRAVSEFTKIIKNAARDSGFSDSGFEPEQYNRWQNLTAKLLEHRNGLATTADYQLLKLEPELYFAQNSQLLYSPMGGLSLAFLSQDPSGLFGNFIAHNSPPEIQVIEAIEGVYSKLLILSISPDKAGLTELPKLYDFYQRMEQQSKKRQLAVFAAGPPLFAAYGVKSAQREISTIGLASISLLILLLLFSLRSFSAVALTLVCIAVGVVAGFVTTVVIFQTMHILTLVFGVSLLGIAADYALHFLAQSRTVGWTPASSLAKVFGALRLSALSSIIAFSSLLILPFPGIRQIGLFMASGLLGSFLTVCLVFPALYKGVKNPRPIAGVWNILPRCPRYGSMGLIVLVLVSFAAINKLPPINDVREFYAAPQSLTSGQEKISSLMPDSADSRYLLVQAPNQDELLSLEEVLAKDLRILQRNGSLAHFSGIANLVPAKATQLGIADLLSTETIATHLRTHMEAIGFDETAQANAIAYLQEPYTPLTISDLLEIELPVGVGGFLGCDSQGCASRIKLSGINSISELNSLSERYLEVELVDPIATINTTMGTYRNAIAKLLLIAAVCISLLLTLRYGWRMAMGILLIPFAACSFSLLIVGSWQGGISLINVMALLLLVGVSLDYAIFRAFTAIGDHAATSLAISLSAATSILAFGILGFSETPVIRSFGQTIAAGLMFAWLFSWFRYDGNLRA